MSKLLRTDLPDPVWDRLNAEAAEHGVKIGVFVKRLIVARDARKFPETGASPSTDPTESESE